MGSPVVGCLVLGEIWQEGQPIDGYMYFTQDPPSERYMYFTQDPPNFSSNSVLVFYFSRRERNRLMVCRV